MCKNQTWCSTARSSRFQKEEALNRWNRWAGMAVAMYLPLRLPAFQALIGLEDRAKWLERHRDQIGT